MAERRPHDPFRILLADDDHDVREAIRDLLRSEGFEITEADSGLSALEILRSEWRRMALSIMDVDMPGMTGFQVMRIAQQQFRLPPCIFISGDDSRERRREALELGAFSLLGKPLDPLLLRISVHQLIEQAFGPPPR